jgi:hypothetical protein
MSMRQTVFEFAIEFRTTVGDEPNNLKIAKGQLSLLVALLGANDGNGNLDDATAKLSEKFEDAGKWRGQVTLGLFREGLIEPIGADNSKRRSRHSGLLRRWRLISGAKARLKIDALRVRIDRLTAAYTQEQDEKGGDDHGK